MSGGDPGVVTKLVGPIDRFQQRRRVFGLPYAVVKRFGEHEGSRLAATVSYYSFFSVFPLLLALVTVLNLVLKDDDTLRQQLLDGAIGQIPVIGTQLAATTEPLPGNSWLVAFGLGTALWAGLGAVAALQQALNVLWDVPVHARGNPVLKRLRSLAFLVLFAVGLVVSTLLVNLAAIVNDGWLTTILGLVGTTLVNAVILAMMFTVLPARRRPLPELLPGVIAGAVGLVALQQLGNFVVQRFIAGASDVYGTFAIVIALLSWFHLVSRVLLMSAELTVVLAADLVPRRLLPDGPPTDADRRATELDVRRIQRDRALDHGSGNGPDDARDDDAQAVTSR